MRATWPLTMPFLVSTEAFWPMTTSLAWVSAIFNFRFEAFGIGNAGRLVPGVTCWPTSTGTTCRTPLDTGADVKRVEFAAFLRS